MNQLSPEALLKRLREHYGPDGKPRAKEAKGKPVVPPQEERAHGLQP